MPTYYMLSAEDLEGNRASPSCEYAWWEHIAGIGIMFRGGENILPKHDAQFKLGQRSIYEITSGPVDTTDARFLCTAHLAAMPPAYKAYEGRPLNCAVVWREILCKIS